MAELPAPADRHVPDTYQGKLEPNYYCRSWNAKREKYCKARAGSGTDHVGQGRCTFHGGSSPIKTGRYSTIKRQRIRELYEEFSEDSDPLDVVDDLNLLRAVTRDYIERFDEWLEAILLWHAAHAGKKAKDPEVREAARLVLSEAAPRKVMDLGDAHKLLDTVSKVVSRIEKVRSDQAISRKDFYRLIQEYARIVDARVDDDLVKEQIKNDWLQVRLA